MVQVGVFTISKPKFGCIERRIFNSVKNILSINEFNSIVYDEDSNGQDVIYTFTDKFKLLEISQVFTKHKVLEEHNVITENFLYQKDIPPIFESIENKKVLSNFLNENLNSDIVLDKINNMGIDSLTEIDLSKLKSPT
jgi:hypothetical protein